MIELSEYADCVQGRRCPECPLAQLGEAEPETAAVNELLDSYRRAEPEGGLVSQADAQDYAKFSDAPKGSALAIQQAAQLIVDGSCETSVRYNTV